MMNRFKENCFVVDEGDGCYNAFALDMFDKNGYLEGHAGEMGYHLDDYDIVAWFNDWEDACQFAEDLNY